MKLRCCAAAFIVWLLPATLMAGQPTVVVAPFFQKSVQGRWFASGIAEALNLRVHHQPSLNSMTLRQVEAAMKEVALSPKDLGDASKAAILGRQLGATIVVSGDYAWGERITLQVRVVDVQKEQVLVSENLEAQGKDAAFELERLGARAMGRALGRQDAAVTPGAVGTQNVRAWQLVAEAFAELREQSLSPRAADPNAPPAFSPDELAVFEKGLNEALTLDPLYGRAWIGLALVHALLDQPPRAWRDLGQATKLDAAEDPLMTLVGAFVRMRQGEMDAAEKILQRAIARHPNMLHARATLGHFYNHFGRFREAAAVFAQFAEVAPENPWVMNQMGYTQAKLGRKAQAIAFAEKALKQLPNSPDLQIELASRYIDGKKWDKARQTLEKVLLAHPEDMRAHARLSYVFLNMNRAEQAAESARKALELANSHRERRDVAYSHLNLARALGQQQALDSAFSHLAKAKSMGAMQFTDFAKDPKLTAMRADPRFQALLAEDL